MSRLLISDDRKSIIMLIGGNGKDISAGGKPMNFLTANTTDAAQEKHVPQKNFCQSRQRRTSDDRSAFDSVDLSADETRRAIRPLDRNR